ncbi:sugar phosphate isomerase/epimerase family protein [Alteromonas gilva]|uniref:Sugar phosphate isomerase/epimerase n=1 Tax=Alteromonas gilva TaxID=2987522 RepID=A0ABT5KYG8_9ALTE|nr:sugar phosphate isomerase/epimerase [Alteromonas gilva]MDC8829815.1 sugar phosphate isomerase/epimerase [Alteromonas gilva]
MSKYSKTRPTVADLASASMSRRHFMQWSATGMSALLGASACGSATTMTTAASDNRVGLQLYTLRSMMEKSVSDTLKLVANVGYKELEFAGFFDNNPSAVKALIDELGLSAPSAHVPLQLLEQDIDKQIEIANIMEHKYMVVPWLPAEQRSKDIAGWQRLAEQLNQFGEKCKANGIQLAYHNHDFEFENIDGQLPYNTLLDECEESLVAMELDLYWTVKAGFNPVDYFKRNPGRFKLWHVKDMDKNGEFADVGKGTINFDDIFANAELSGIEHKFVERDRTDNLVETIKQGYLAVSRLNDKY